MAERESLNDGALLCLLTLEGARSLGEAERWFG